MLQHCSYNVASEGGEPNTLCIPSWRCALQRDRSASSFSGVPNSPWLSAPLLHYSLVPPSVYESPYVVHSLWPILWTKKQDPCNAMASVRVGLDPLSTYYSVYNHAGGCLQFVTRSPACWVVVCWPLGPCCCDMSLSAGTYVDLPACLPDPVH
jgi:hypothetical protein